MFNYFTYNGNNSLDIIGTRIFITRIDDRGQDETPYEREILRNEKSVNKYISNSYGTKYSNNLTFPIGMVKENLERFTVGEIRLITSWLMSTNKDMKLEFHCENFDNLYYYMGQFKTVKQTVSDGTACLVCTFECDSPFAYEDVITRVTNNGGLALNYNCTSDVKDMISYPKLKILPTSSNRIVITMSDHPEPNQLRISPSKNVAFEIDCDLCTVKDALGDFMDLEDLGIINADGLYWPYFYPGINKMFISGDLEMVIEETVPRGVGAPTWF